MAWASIYVLEISSKTLINSIAIFCIWTKTRSCTSYDKTQINNSTTKTITRAIIRNFYISQISHITEYRIRTLPHLHRMHMNRSCRHRHCRCRRQHCSPNHWLLFKSWRTVSHTSCCLLIFYLVLFQFCHHLYSNVELNFWLDFMQRKFYRVLRARTSCKECRFITKRKSHECIHNTTHSDCYCCGIDDIKYAEKRNEKKELSLEKELKPQKKHIVWQKTK